MAAIKIIITGQYYSIRRYKNLKREILKCNWPLRFLLYLLL